MENSNGISSSCTIEWYICLIPFFIRQLRSPSNTVEKLILCLCTKPHVCKVDGAWTRDVSPSNVNNRLKCLSLDILFIHFCGNMFQNLLNCRSVGGPHTGLTKCYN